MVVYEVRLTIDPSIRTAFLSWLDEHVAEMLTFDGFVAAQILTGDTSEPDELSVHYTLENRAYFAHYEQTHADRMRAEGLTLFPRGLSATRRLWDTQQFKNSNRA